MPAFDARRLIAPGLTAAAVAALSAPLAFAHSGGGTAVVGMAAESATPGTASAGAPGDALRTLAADGAGPRSAAPATAPTAAPTTAPATAPAGPAAGPAPVVATATSRVTATATATAPAVTLTAAGPSSSAPAATATITVDPTQVPSAVSSSGLGDDPGTVVLLSSAQTAPATVPTTVVAATTVPVSQSSVPLTSGGWHSGASGDLAASGGFGTWRGKQIQAAAVWGDTSAAEQTSISALDAYSWFDGDVDVAVGGLAPGETWAQAAQGAYVERWRAAVRSVKARRDGRAGTTYLRFAHEMNGDWFDWKVTSGNVDAFHTAWRLFTNLVRTEYPAARVVFSPNNGNHSDVPVSQIYPGDDVVDVIGVDVYDGWPAVTTAAQWAAYVGTTEQGGQPYAPGSWQAFAQQHGKPISFPEWGLRDGDHPAFIQGMHDFLAANAAAPGATGSALAGKVVYDVYFDIANGGNQNFMITGGANPQSAALYRSLTWGV